MSDRVRVAVFTPTIRPGGGPAGYVHNWRAAVSQELADFQNSYSFTGRDSSSRTLELPATLREGSLAHRALHGVNRLVRGRMRTARDRLTTLSPNHATALHEIQAADIVVIQAFQSPHLARAARRLGKKIVYMPHSPTPTADERAMLAEGHGRQFPRWEHSQLLAIEAELIRLADCVVFPSLGASEWYRKAFQDSAMLHKVHFIPSGVPDPVVKRPLGGPFATGDPTLAFAGRYVAHKGFDLYCLAAARSKERGLGLQFVSLGAGPITARDPVVDLGWCPQPHEILRSVSCVVIANRVAYYDLLPLEVAALGVPMIMTPVGGNVDQADLLPGVVLSKGTSPEALVDAMVTARDLLHRDPSFGTANRLAFEKHFTLEAFAKRWDDALTSVWAGDWETLD